MTEADFAGLLATVFEWLSKVLASAAAVAAIIYKWVVHMITEKVKEQLTAAVAPLTDATSKSIESLRNEMRQQNETSERKAAERLDTITTRIDSLFALLTGHHK